MKNYWHHPEVEVKDLLGKTITSIEVNKDTDEIKFACSDGSTYAMYHWQNCCEGVMIEEIIGDIEDLIGNPLLQAEVVSNSGTGENKYDDNCDIESVVLGYWPEDAAKPDYAPESYTWTFYKFATIKGGVTLRWYGSSNGCYSEGVTLSRTDIKSEDL